MRLEGEDDGTVVADREKLRAEDGSEGREQFRVEKAGAPRGEPCEAARGWGPHRGVLKGRAREKGQAMHRVGHHRGRFCRSHLGRALAFPVARATSRVRRPREAPW